MFPHNNGQWGTEALVCGICPLVFFKLFSKIGKGVPGLLLKKGTEWPLKRNRTSNTGKVREYVAYNFNYSCNIGGGCMFCEYE